MSNPKQSTATLARKGLALAMLRGSQAAFNMATVVMMSRGMSESTLSTALFLLSITLSSGRVGVLGFDVILVQVLGRTDPHEAVTRNGYANLAGRFLTIWMSIAAVALCLWGVIAAAGYQRWLVDLFGISPLWVLIWLFLAAVQIFQSSVLLGFNRQLGSLLYMGALSNFVTLLLVLGQLVLRQGISLEGLVCSYLGGLLVSVVSGQITIYKLMGWVAPQKPFKRTQGQTSNRTLAGSAAINALSIVATQIPFWVVIVLGSDAEVVTYGLAFRLMLPLSIVLLSARTMVAPLITRAVHQGQLSSIEPRLRQTATGAFVVTIAMSAVLLGLHDWLFNAVFQRPDARAIVPLAWLLLGQSVSAYCGPGQYVLRIAGHGRTALLLTLGASLAQAIFAFGFYQYLGVSGAAASAAVFAIVGGVLPSLVVRHRLKTRIDASLRPVRNRKGLQNAV